MAKDTALFMWILLSMAYGYAVASESLLNKEKTWPDLYKVAQKSFFSMFGDFSLDNIENKEDARTWKWVPVYLGFFVIATNVLLLNLLIARLSSRYTKMEAKANEYRVWMKYQVFQEIQNRSWFPPPFNILYALVALVTTLCCSLRQRWSPASGGGRCSSCHRQQGTAGSGGRGSCCGCLKMQNTYRKRKSQTATGRQQESQMHGTCLNVWNNEGTDDEKITVSTMDFKKKTKAKLHKKRHPLICKSHPTEVIEFDSIEPNYQDQKKHLDTFEKKQAEWAIQQIGRGDSAQ